MNSPSGTGYYPAKTTFFFLRSLLLGNAADIIGLMSGKVKYYVGELSVSQILLSMKLSGNLVMSHWKTGPRMLSNNIICLFYQTGGTIDNLTWLGWWIFRSRHAVQ